MLLCSFFLIFQLSTLSYGDSFFENLRFGESRNVVERKLDKNARIQAPTSSLFGRSSNIYKVKQTYAGLKYTLQFFWNDQDQTLSRLDLHSDSHGQQTLKTAYKETSQILTALYGKPFFQNSFLSAENPLRDSEIRYFSGWHQAQFSIMIGAANFEQQTILVISFYNKELAKQWKK